MSNNVVQLFKPKKPSEIPVDLNIHGLVMSIADWAEANGIDIYDTAFQIRVTDLMSQLQVMARETRKTA